MPAAYVQSANNRGAAGSVATAFGSNVAAASVLVASLFLEDVTATVASVTDSLGNTYTQAGTLLSMVSTGSIAIYYAYNTTAGANTVSATLSNSTAVTLVVTEGSGIMSAATPFDATAGATGSGTDTPNSGSLSTSVSGDWLFAFSVNNRGNVAAAGGYTRRESFVFNAYSDSFDQVAGAAGSYAATTATMPATGQWAIRLVAFKPPAAGGAVLHTRTLLGAGA